MKRVLSWISAAALAAVITGCQSMGPHAVESGCMDGSCGDGSYATLDDGAWMDAGACSDGSCGPMEGYVGEGVCADGTCGHLHRGRLFGLGILPWLAGRSREHCTSGCRGKAQGPTMGAVTYPYYTVRGPRDFLQDNPPSIGP